MLMVNKNSSEKELLHSSIGYTRPCQCVPTYGITANLIKLDQKTERTQSARIQTYFKVVRMGQPLSCLWSKQLQPNESDQQSANGIVFPSQKYRGVLLITWHWFEHTHKIYEP